MSPPFTAGWLTKAGTYTVEKMPMPHLSTAVDLAKPRVGVMHTTEGGFDSALSVFRQHYAPHFMVGTDSKGHTRILQFVPLGTMASALQNHTGGVETNRWAHVQIELVGRSSMEP